MLNSIRLDDPGGTALKMLVLMAGITVLVLGSIVLDGTEKN